ncbi:uncharacterized protein DNG_04561 [Cephalotrichum gorgonifer]|uniref:Uncharacterized protein n=1 Tax=Cephalotrichum gorgonifer TaxID=2041049 RepID=A0AAE8SUN8_9PEZI|nr:uncharacterized protein DNG_04561 [Cephalotrichum gorgonifer]
MAAYSEPWYCVRELRCRLCQFYLEPGDLIVVGSDDECVSSVLPFRPSLSMVMDGTKGVGIHLGCDEDCWKGGYFGSAFHVDCYNTRVRPVTWAFLNATEYGHVPPFGGEGRRRRRIQDLLTARLESSFLKELPAEICHLVAGFFVQQCAAITLQELVADDTSYPPPDLHQADVDLARDVYARYIHVEGVQYVRSLSNEPPSEAQESVVRVFKARPGRVVRTVYVRYDHIGVRGVWFTLPKEDFVTNLGREVLFGHHLRETTVLIHRLFATTGEPSRIYVNEWGRRSVNRFIEFIAVESNAESDDWVQEDHRSDYPRSLMRDSPPAGTLEGEALCYSHCRMEDVAEITLCVGRISGIKAVIGLLLRYNNGRRSCLGRYRLDWTLAPVRVDPARMLRIGMGQTDDELPYVAEVGVGGVSGPESLTWVDVPWKGRLVWWFAHSHCRLEYVE